MANERLRAQLARKGLTVADLASSVDVDPKTVERWIQAGRVPFPRHRRRAMELLQVPESYLWPELLDDERNDRVSRAELVELYPHRGSVPPGLWRELMTKAEQHVDVLVYAGLFLVDVNPDFATMLQSTVESGLRARLAFGDPDSSAVRARGEEEGIGSDLAARIRISLGGVRAALGCEGVEVRLHDTVLYNSIYRFDDEMLINAHVVGSPAARNPVLHLRRLDGGQYFDRYVESFEWVWDRAAPLAAVTES